MTAPVTRLYTGEVLALATQLAALPLDPAMPFQGRARSSSCGSTLEMSLALDGAGCIAGLGIGAQACAIGQASAAIFANAACGRSSDGIAQSAADVARWLEQGGELPDWPGFAAIAAARDYPGRHGAIMLPWRAALDALSTSDCAR